MNILYISKSIIPSRTANSIHVMKMCQALAENGHNVILLAPNIPKYSEKNVQDIYDYYGVKKIFYIKKLFHPNIKAGALIYTFSILFYLFFNKNFNLIYGRFLHGCYVAALLKYTVIYESHESILEIKKHRLLILKKLVRNKHFKKMIVISNSLKNIYLDNNYFKKITIQVAHDGSDEVVNFDSKIALLGSKDKLTVGYVGHLYKGRGIKTIISCAKEINEMTFHIVGGFNEDIKYWNNYIKNLNLNNIFIYGFVPPKETLKYKNTFDILIAPYEKKVSIQGSGDTSKYMSPLKIFEYMSHKKPIIVSDFPVIREVLNDNNSILVNSEDISLWINSIRKLKNKKTRDSISKQALIDFYKYTWKNRALLVI